MKRAVLALATTAAGLVGVLSYRTPPPATPGAVSAQSTPSSGGTATSATRTITGDSVSTRWGPVQVAITVDDAGKITKVTVLQAPDSNGRDREINDYALPVLQSETLTAQSADVDTVSGATYTSEGYLGSLQSALDKR